MPPNQRKACPAEGKLAGRVISVSRRGLSRQRITASQARPLLKSPHLGPLLQFGRSSEYIPSAVADRFYLATP